MKTISAEVKAELVVRTNKVEAAKALSAHSPEARKDAKKAIHAAKESLRRFKIKHGIVDGEEVVAPGEQGMAMLSNAFGATEPAAMSVEQTAIVLSPMEAAKATQDEQLIKANKQAAKDLKRMASKPAPVATSEKTYRDVAEFMSLNFAVDATELAEFIGVTGGNAKVIAERVVRAIGGEWTTTDSGTFAQLFQDGQELDSPAFNENMAQAAKNVGADKFDSKIEIDAKTGSHPVHPRCPHCGKPMFKSMNAGKVQKSDAWAFCRNVACLHWNQDQSGTFNGNVAKDAGRFLSPEQVAAVMDKAEKAQAAAKGKKTATKLNKELASASN